MSKYNKGTIIHGFPTDGLHVMSDYPKSALLNIILSKYNFLFRRAFFFFVFVFLDFHYVTVYFGKSVQLHVIRRTLIQIIVPFNNAYNIGGILILN